MPPPTRDKMADLLTHSDNPLFVIFLSHALYCGERLPSIPLLDPNVDYLITTTSSCTVFGGVTERVCHGDTHTTINNYSTQNQSPVETATPIGHSPPRSSSIHKLYPQSHTPFLSSPFSPTLNISPLASLGGPSLTISLQVQHRRFLFHGRCQVSSQSQHGSRDMTQHSRPLNRYSK